jgi:primosomal protein N' (replication factor Y)
MHKSELSVAYCEVCVLFVGDPKKPLLTYAVPEDNLVEPGQVVMVPWGKKTTPAVVLDVHQQKPDFATKPVGEKLYNWKIPEHLRKCAYWMSQYYYEPLRSCFETVVFAKKTLSKAVKMKLETAQAGKLPAHTLTPAQTEAYEMIRANLDRYGNYLIHGVTGSGKTEIYLKLIEEVLAKNRQALYLVPEIGLTPQTVQRVRERIGAGVYVVNSELAIGERIRIMKAMELDQVKVIIGSRSALFAPLDRLGLVVIDEAHDNSYIQDASPHYHTVKTAEFVARELQIPLVLGTATPKVSELYRYQQANAETSRKIFSLAQRAHSGAMPDVIIADMREELKKHNYTTISDTLQQKVQESLEKKEQVVLFISRRGFAQSFLCRSCGWKAECENCMIALVYHHQFEGRAHQLACHLCNYHRNVDSSCQKCGSVLVKALGSGTERVMWDIRQIFPQARLLRMDRDTTARKGSHQEIFEKFQKGEADILVGTQMVTKGWDIPKVTTVGVINADMLLHRPTFDASEQAFGLITQVIGRAGRSPAVKGAVVIQTYTPEHYALVCAARHDYLGFYEQELMLRKRFYYPPFCTLATLCLHGENLTSLEEKCARIALELKNKVSELEENAIMLGKVEILGPTEAPHAKIKGVYYMQIVLKGQKQDLDVLIKKCNLDCVIKVQE